MVTQNRLLTVKDFTSMPPFFLSVAQAALPSEDGLGQPETESTGKDSFANFKLPHFRRQALEATATSPTRIYGLQGLDEYRTGKSGGVDGFWAGGSGDSMDTVGGKHANWVGKPPEVRTGYVHASYHERLEAK